MDNDAIWWHEGPAPEAFSKHPRWPDGPGAHPLGPRYEDFSFEPAANIALYPNPEDIRWWMYGPGFHAFAEKEGNIVPLRTPAHRGDDRVVLTKVLGRETHSLLPHYERKAGTRRKAANLVPKKSS